MQISIDARQETASIDGNRWLLIYSIADTSTGASYKEERKKE